MATDWIVPTGASLFKVAEAAILKDTNQNTAEGTESGSETDLSAANRRDQQVEMAVDEVRGAIRTAGRYGYSATEGSVPPEGERHTLIIALYNLVMSTPSLARSFLIGESGKTPLERRYDEAMAWLKELRSGSSFTEPPDVVGQDWETEVDTESDPPNMPISGIRWGDNLGDDTEYDAGVNDNGVVIDANTQNMISW